MEPVEIEGTWEQIVAQGSRYADRWMRLTVLPELARDHAGIEDARSLEQKIMDLATQVPESEWEKLPADLGDNLDHYIYGTRRR